MFSITASPEGGDAPIVNSTSILASKKVSRKR